MAEATITLSPKTLERIRQHRTAVAVLAQREARKAVIEQLRGQGLKPSHYSRRDISVLAEAELERNRARLIAEAKHAIETWPGFARWRLPPELIAESVRKVRESEHSPSRKLRNGRGIEHERHCAGHSEPNTAPATAQRGLSATRILNRKGGRAADRSCTQARAEWAEGRSCYPLGVSTRPACPRALPASLGSG